MKIPKTKLSKMQMDVINELLDDAFIEGIEQSEYREMFRLPPSEWSEQAKKYWDNLDLITNRVGGEIRSKLYD